MGDNHTHLPPCEPLAECKEGVSEKMELILEKIEQISKTQKSMAEIVTAWNNTKGFVNTIQLISKVLRWASITGAAIAAIWYAITHGTMPK